MEYETIKYNLINSYEIKLLTKNNASLILSFLYDQFKQKEKIIISESELETKLEDYLEYLRETEPEVYPRKAREYLTQWCEDGLVRKSYKTDSDNPVFELTPATEKVISWLEYLEKNDFIATESRFLQIFSILKEIKDKSTEDPEIRIAQLEQDRDGIQQEIDLIRETGKVENYNSTQIQERFNNAQNIARGLIADFRQIEQKFRDLKEKITSAGFEAKTKKGSIVAKFLDADAELKESNQGKSFYTFFQFLQSDQKQQELEELIESVYSLEDLSLPDSKDESLRRIKSRLIREAQHIVQSNYRLAAKIRQMLDESNLEENRRVAELIREIQSLAVKIKDNPPLEPDLLLLEAEPELNLFMDRPLHSLQESPSPSLSIDLNIPEIDLEADLSQIYNQVYVDETLLRNRIEEILATRNEITLAELVELYPVTKGLTEIVAYIAIAKQENIYYINETKVDEKKRKAEEYDKLAKLLELPLYQDKDTFFVAKEKGELLKEKIAEKIAKIEIQRDELVSQRRELEKQQKEIQAELDSLRQRKSQIPQKNLNIRDRIANQLNIDKTDLPFIGELLKVSDHASEWEGGIERLLKGFGLCILVSDRNYQQVNSYVNNNSLKGRLVYYRVTKSPPQATQRQVNLSTVPAKLEIKPDNQIFSQWLNNRLVQFYNYTCCDLEQFARQTRAITKTGLIKHGGERHEKDDSSRIGDRRHYILGWDNAAKIAAIEAELDSVNRKLNELNKQIKSLEKKRKQRRQQESWLQDLMNFTDFAEIDWRSSEQEKQKLARDLAELEVSSDRLKQLQFQLKNVQQEIAATDSQRDRLIKEIQTFENNLDRYQQEQLECRASIDEVEITKVNDFAKDNLNRLRQSKLDLANIDSVREKIISKFGEQLKSKERSRNESKSAVLIRITNFRNNFRDTTLEMNFLTLPELKNSFAIWGAGYKTHILKSVDWLNNRNIFYWGDIDPDGLKILSQFRSYFPQTISIMMDKTTYKKFEEFTVDVESSQPENLPHLTSEEYNLYTFLCQQGKRLEQEHISQKFIDQYLIGCMENISEIVSIEIQKK